MTGWGDVTNLKLVFFPIGAHPKVLFYYYNLYFIHYKTTPYMFYSFKVLLWNVGELRWLLLTLTLLQL